MNIETNQILNWSTDLFFEVHFGLNACHIIECFSYEISFENYRFKACKQIDFVSDDQKKVCIKKL